MGSLRVHYFKKAWDKAYTQARRRGSPKDAAEFFAGAYARPFILGVASGMKECILEHFPAYIGCDTPAELEPLLNKLQQKVDLDSLGRLKEFIFNMEGGKDEFMHLAEALCTKAEAETEEEYEEELLEAENNARKYTPPAKSRWTRIQAQQVKASIGQRQNEHRWFKSVGHRTFFTSLCQNYNLRRELISILLPEYAGKKLDLSTLHDLYDPQNVLQSETKLCDKVYTVCCKDNSEKKAVIVLRFQGAPRMELEWQMLECQYRILKILRNPRTSIFSLGGYPRIIMVVYYNGSEEWHPCVSTQQCFASALSDDPAADALSSSYHLFDARHQDHKELEGRDDLPALIVRAERAVHLAEDETAMQAALNVMNKAWEMAHEKDIRVKDYRNVLRWCERITMIFGLRAFIARREPKLALEIARLCSSEPNKAQEA